MSVLPKTAANFTDPAYWKKFFAERKSPFEWYGDYESLSGVLEKYIKPSDKFLQVGCGNSELASQLYDNGFRSIHSIDVEASVIADQRRRNKAREELIFEEGDATKLDSKDESFTVVIDKGTLDALLPPNASKNEEENVGKMFDEVMRVLQSGGRYLIITLAQPHLIDFWVEHFNQKKQYILRIQKVENKASGFPMPVFVLIATKLRIAMSASLPLEVWRSNASKVERVKSSDEMKLSIIAEQEISQFIHLCSKKLDQEVSIDFQGEDGNNGPRYRLYVLDDVAMKKCEKFAAFIVPIGRDAEWLFATEKGRQGLRRQCGHDRLVVIFLNRQQTYANLQIIKNELGHFVSLLDNRSTDLTGNYDILSAGTVDVAKKVAAGESEINGKWQVEEVNYDGVLTRRLVFLSTMNLVQSEAVMKTGKKNRKIVDLDVLSCEFHQMMVSGLAFSTLQPLARNDVQMKMAVLGLGGGLLTAFLLRAFKKSTVIGIELDADVIKIATEYFSFPHSDPRLQVKCMDALVYLEQTAKSDEKLDALFVDVSGNQDAALQCPPPVFLTEKVLTNMIDSISENGLVLLNLVTRDNEVSAEVKRNVEKHFKQVFVISSSEDVNEVLICLKTPLSSTQKPDPNKLVNQIRREISDYDSICSSLRRLRVA